MMSTSYKTIENAEAFIWNRITQYFGIRPLERVLAFQCISSRVISSIDMR